MTRTVWDKRFGDKEKTRIFEIFNASITVDRFLAEQEIAASEAYARGLHKAAFLTDSERDIIVQGLEKVRERIRGGEDLRHFEDIHSAVELMLTEEVGEPGRKLHTGRSRNEQVVTDERLFLKQKIPEAIGLIEELQKALVREAEKHLPIVMPGYSHLQRGQVILYSHYLMSFFWPLERGKSRLQESLSRVDVLPLGSGALAGSTADLDRNYLKDILEFSEISANSIDSVSDRSFILETLFAFALLLLDLGRMASDFILFSSAEFAFLELDDSLATSSSLMPQKKNPDIFELIRAAPARLYADMTQLFLVIKGLPSSYNKDLQEDKEPLAQGVDTALEALKIMGLAISRIKPVPQKMELAIDSSLYATDLAEYLVAKGVPFREAHGCVGEIVRHTIEKGKSLDTLTDEEFQDFHAAFGPELKRIFDPRVSIRRKKTAGSTHPEKVKEQIDRAKLLLTKKQPLPEQSV